MILDNIQELREKLFGADEADNDTVNAWEKQVKKALALIDLKNHAGIKMIVEKYETELKAIDIVLLNDENLKDDERKFLFKKKNWARSFLNLFTEAENNVNEIDSKVSENLKHLQDVQ